jgi:uncharacterized membrane protein YhhN
MTAALIFAAAIAAGLAIRAHYLEPDQRWQIYAFKPLATLLILGLALSLSPARPEYQWAIAAGLLFSTAGDVFLMLPQDRFVAGLASFLVAHLCYVWAFTIGVPFGAAPLLWLPFILAGGAVLVAIWPGLKPALRAPVTLYVIVIVAMAGQAAGRWHALGSALALAAAIGAGFFVVSDSILALDRFRKHFHAARALTLTTYWIAQLLIAISVSGA